MAFTFSASRAPFAHQSINGPLNINRSRTGDVYSATPERNTIRKLLYISGNRQKALLEIITDRAIGEQ